MSLEARPVLVPTETTLGEPRCPTLVFASFKGGVCKTGTAIPAAELLAYQGVRVLLITSDQQHDAYKRLGVRNGEHSVTRGAGQVEVLGVPESRLMDVVYGDALQGSQPEVIVIDTPPHRKYAALPGVMLAVPVDGSLDTQNNVSHMLKSVPANSRCVLLGISSKGSGSLDMSDADWKAIVRGMTRGLPKNITCIPNVLKHSDEIARLHTTRDRSVWELPRHHASRTFTFLNGVHELCVTFMEEFMPEYGWIGPPDVAPSRQVPRIKGFNR